MTVNALSSFTVVAIFLVTSATVFVDLRNPRATITPAN